jgi:hypothetical protein
VHSLNARFIERLRTKRSDLVDLLIAEKRMTETLSKGLLDELNAFKNSTL